MRKRLTLLLVLLVAASATAAFSDEINGTSVRVEIGGSEEFDACPGLGEVVGLKPDGDNFLAVRKGPGAQFAETNRIHTGARLMLCDEDGSWLGIIYPSPGQEDCGVAAPKAVREPYDGPCRSGWVHSRFVSQITG